MSGAPVISAGSLIGVVSVTDVLEFEEGNPGVPRLREGATDDTEWAGGEDEENLPADFFTEGWAPSAADTLQRIRSSDSPEWDALDEHIVEEIMTRKVIGLPSTATVNEAAKRMVKHRIHRVLVIDDGALAGIVTTSDIVRAVAQGKL